MLTSLLLAGLPGTAETSAAAYGGDAETTAQWVFFTDRGPALSASADGPVHAAYVDAVANVAHLRHVTNWFNGVSVDADESQAERLRALPFVRSVGAVATFAPPTPVPAPAPPNPFERPARASVLDYGPSITQDTLINADALHDMGLTGDGVLIGFLDSGFNYLDHPAFAHVTVVDQWDFVDDDGDVAYGSTTDHGTEVMSCAVAYSPGNLIGTAYNADVALARTEDVAVERRYEAEDFWVAGAEWLVDSVGVDVISSSVIYNWFDLGWNEDYQWEEADGNSTIITQAADKAAGKGVVVVVAAGNERTNGYSIEHWNGGKILLPGDGDSVITVGAATPSGVYSYFSSPGPTADGRIKPDVAALGSGVWMVRGSKDLLNYESNSGTSYATPLVAGVCALLLEAHPGWDPLAIRTALQLSGTQAVKPDTNLGWGVIDALRAHRADYAVFGQAVSVVDGKPVYNSYVRLFDGAEQQVAEEYTGDTGWFVFENLDPGTYHVRGYVEDSTLVADSTITIPLVAPRTLRIELEAPDTVGDPSRPERFWVGAPFPNPANPTISIEYRVDDVVPGEAIRLRIVTTTGQHVRSERVSVSAQGLVRWDGRDDLGRPVAGGVYFATLTLGDESATRRVVLLR